MYRKCPKCEINYLNENEELCEVCRKDESYFTTKTEKDDNKTMVERDLVPLLRLFDKAFIEKFTKKEESFEFFGLRRPLLIECKDLGVDVCRKEIKDRKGNNRYYIDQYMFFGKKYHICSQWWSAKGNHSKEVLKMLKGLKENNNPNN